MSRRWSLPLLALALVAAACGGGADAADTSSSGSASASGSATGSASASGSTPTGDASTEASAFPVTIEHTHGETEITEKPERVVTVGLRDQDAVLALGVAPVGIKDWFGEQPNAVWPWAQDELGDADPTVLDPAELDLETIASLDPDVIIGVDSGLTEDDYALLSEIAPTVAQPSEHPDFAVPWRDRTMIVARALGEVERAEQVIADVEASIQAAADAHPEFAESTALIGLAGADGQAYAYGSDDVRSRFLTELGFTVPEVIEEQVPEDSFFVTLSQERFDQLDADVLLWIGGDAAAFENVTSVPVYPQRVVEEGRDLFLPYDPIGGAISFSSALSLPFLVDELVPELAAAVDGDSATASEFGR
jgi:iron complex transport system substrate-binding protein